MPDQLVVDPFSLDDRNEGVADAYDENRQCPLTDRGCVKTQFLGKRHTTYSAFSKK
jgi:hypothetical protein